MYNSFCFKEQGHGQAKLSLVYSAKSNYVMKQTFHIGEEYHKNNKNCSCNTHHYNDNQYCQNKTFNAV